jgi:hypothetical protein
MYKLFLIFLIFLTSCGTVFKKKETTSPTSQLILLENKSALYVDLIQDEGHQDAQGFIMTSHCDATLFSGLFAAARPDLLINIRAAASADLSQWFRRPGQDCGSAFGNSRSTISRDMMLGVFWYIWKAKDLEAAEILMEQLRTNFYQLEGQGTAGELLMTPALINTLAQLILALGGKRYSIELMFPAVFGKGVGYVSHLTAWHILLRGDMLGHITEAELDILEFHKNRNPLNPLFQAAYHKYVDGNQDKAIKLLLNSSEWPSNKLPTTEEHCSDWPIQRDAGDDWEPCNPVNTHTGAELVILYELLIKKAN